MFSNNNGKIIGRLSKASLKSGKLRNRFVGAAIVLAAFLLTFTATWGYNEAMAYKNYAKYQVMMTRITDDQFQSITKSPEVEKYGLYQDVGTGKDGNITIKLIYADEPTAYFLNFSTLEGNMPTAANEVIIDREYAGDKAVGDKISVEYRNYLSREIVTNEFIISGFMKSSTNYNATTNTMFVSKKFVEQDPLLSQYRPDLMLRIKDSSSYTNKGIRDKILEIGTAAGIPEENVLYNSLNIDSNNTTGETNGAILAIAIVILLASSLVIYNIFYVSIIGKVKEYGQLRTIGTTRKQVRKIVYLEGRLLSLMYIPIGTLLGLVASYFAGPSKWVMSADIVVGIVCTVIVFITVMASVRKPAKLAANSSPVEAASYVGVVSNKKKSKNTARKLNHRALGIANLFRNKKKAGITFISLIFSGVLFITVTTLLGSIDPAVRADAEFANGGEYKVQFNTELYSPSVGLPNMQLNSPMSNELIDDFMKIEGIDQIIASKEIEGVISNLKKNNDFTINEVRKDQLNELSKYLVSGQLEEVFQNEEAVILNLNGRDYPYYNVDYKLGDKVPVVLYDGDKRIEKTFTIVGIIDNPDWVQSFYYDDNKIGDLIEQNPNIELEIISKQGPSKDVEAQILEKIANEEKLVFLSRSLYINRLLETLKGIRVMAFSFTVFIAFFAIVNLVNTIITNILSRRKEIGLLQAVGMTKNQVIAMLNVENSIYIFGSFTISVIFGNILGSALSSIFSKIPGLGYIVYRFPAGEILLYLGIMLFIYFVVIVFIKKEIPKQSIIERIREN